MSSASTLPIRVRRSPGRAWDYNIIHALDEEIAALQLIFENAIEIMKPEPDDVKAVKVTLASEKFDDFFQFRLVLSISLSASYPLDVFPSRLCSSNILLPSSQQYRSWIQKDSTRRKRRK
jgi:hypothetical protein